jgi:hypothetical protein
MSLKIFAEEMSNKRTILHSQKNAMGTNEVAFP